MNNIPFERVRLAGVVVDVDIFEVILSKSLIRELTRVPKHIVISLQGWIESVKEDGLALTRKIPGYHDEPIKGKERAGQRSIRLNKAWRAFYRIDESSVVHFIEVIEVNKHEY